MPTFAIECVVECQNNVGESPIWDIETGELWWVDSTGRRVGRPSIFRWNPKTDVLREWSLDLDIGSIALRRDGGLVLAGGDGIYVFDPDRGELERRCTVETMGGRLRLNDGKCDREGRFYVGGMDDKEELKAASLYRLDPDFTLTEIDTGIICSNGPCFSPDNRTFYFADTFQDEIWAYDFDLTSGTVANRRLFSRTDAAGGVADGSTVDAEGYLWNAELISGNLVRYAPDGTVDRRIGMPVRNVTSVMFGGDGLDDIYVTTMARVMHPAVHDRFVAETRPQFGAGALFRIRGLGIRGLPETRFAG